MKKGISIILFIILARVCDGQLIIPTTTTTVTTPAFSLTRTLGAVQYSESWDGTDSLGNPVHVMGLWSGNDADSARLSALWRVTYYNNKYGWAFTKAQIQSFITKNGLK